MALKALTLLHSNDFHGDFLPTVDEGVTAGGVAQLSGYVKQTRAENPATIYAIAGDMFRGSVLDSEFKGVSTIDIMNMVEPDIATLGNHEVDYGVPHLLFLEKYADFPIINANMYLKNRNKRLFTSHKVLEVEGLRVLFVGLVTPDTLSQTNADQLVGEHIDFGDPLPEVRRVCSLYRRSNVDLTVVLSHLGWEADRKLAESIDPAWGVDLIIGGHSHLSFKEPDVVNGIPIVQLGMGSRHIGRFDLVVDTEANALHSYEWKQVRLSPDVSPVDQNLANHVNELQRDIDEKYNRTIIELARTLTHPVRYKETELGNFFCDIFKCVYEVDIALFSSASLRGEELGPVVTLDNLLSMMPYDGPVAILQANGDQLKRAVHHLMRDENWQDNPKFFQVSRGLKVEYDRVKREIIRFELDGQPIDDERSYQVLIDEYHYLTLLRNFGLTPEQVNQNGLAYTLPIGYRMAALHYFAQIHDARMRAETLGHEIVPVNMGGMVIDPAEPLDSKVEGRVIIHHPEGFYAEN